jgi:hypothetical protein
MDLFPQLSIGGSSWSLASTRGDDYNLLPAVHSYYANLFDYIKITAPLVAGLMPTDQELSQDDYQALAEYRY